MILTNDPSMTAWGWAVIDWSGQVKAAGCIKTKSGHKKRKIRKGDDTIRRLKLMNNALIEKIRTYDVRYIVSEQPHGSQSASAALMVGACLDKVQTLSDAIGIPVEWYSENDVKQHIFGRKSVTKKEMKGFVASTYRVDWTDVKYRDEAIADAIAVYHTAQAHSAAIQLMKNAT